jgi:O-acetyl-ADP-ribose deacetylase (regulator of RNase III)
MEKSIWERIEIRQGDITKLEVDAIVNAANTTLKGGGGVDGAIHRAAGPELLAECRTLGGCPTGEARITAGYKLPARHVIHTVGPIYKGTPRDAHLLAACYRNSLKLVAQHKLLSVAFPAISCGVYGYPIQDACQIAVETCLDFMRRHEFPSLLIFMLFSASDREVYEQCLAGKGV